jgi:hypothetical protein
MRKCFCDCCGKEILGNNNDFPSQIRIEKFSSYDMSMEICNSCVSKIILAVNGLKNGGSK